MKLADLCHGLNRLIPLHLAQPWDNVGLLVGNHGSECRKVMMTIDCTANVAQEAIQHKADLLLCYHPPLFQPVRRIGVNADDPTSHLLSLIQHGIAVYAVHTALDAAEGGTNDVLANACGARHLEPFEYVDEPTQKVKVVTFVPQEEVDAVADAMSHAGAGIIGEYTQCSFRIPGTGTFRGSDSSNPTIGQAGHHETVREIRLEMIVDQKNLPAVLQAIRDTHSYEEPAYDVYPLQSRKLRGIGRVGHVSEPITLGQLGAKLKQALQCPSIQMVGNADASIRRIAACAGAAGSLPFALSLDENDCIVTGEMKHHDALRINRMKTNAIVLGHWASERPVLEPLMLRLKLQFPDLDWTISRQDCDPLWTI